MPSNKKAGTLQGVVLILPITLTVMGAVLLAPIMPKLMEAFDHIDNANYLVPILISIPALCIAVGAPVAGALADKVGRRKLLIWSIGLYTLCGVMPLALSSYLPLLLSRIGVGICEAIIITCSTTLIGDYFVGEQRDKWLGSQTAVASFSAMCLFPLAGLLGAEFGWQGPFAIYGLGFFMMLGILLFTWEVTEEQGDKAVGQHLTQQQQKMPWGHLLKVCLFTLVGGVMFYILQFQLSSALATFNINDPSKAGWMLSVASIGVPVGAIAYGFARHWMSLRALIITEFAMLALGFWGMASASSPQMLVASGLLNQFGAGMMLPTLLTWAVSSLSFSIRGKGTGIWQSTFAIGQFASTLLFAFALSMVGQDNFMETFKVFSAIAFIMVLVSVFSVQKKASHSATNSIDEAG